MRNIPRKDGANIFEKFISEEKTHEKENHRTLPVCSLLAIAVVGVSLAYLTDTDKAVNTFTVGNIDVVLSETCKVTDSKGNEIANAVKTENGVTSFTGLVPSYQITKTPVITNDKDSNEAYVRVAVVVNNLVEINNAIDEVYEKTTPAHTEDDIQAIYDNVFAGWGISHLKTTAEPRRMWMKDRDDSKVLAIDMAAKIASNGGYYTQFSITNKFMSDAEANDANKDGVLDYGDPGESYYTKALSPNERVYVFYLKLAPKESYTLFSGLNIPADFTADQMKMFNGLKIAIYADAIQSAGFTDYTEAFNALEKEHPLGWWNS